MARENDIELMIKEFESRPESPSYLVSNRVMKAMIHTLLERKDLRNSMLRHRRSAAVLTEKLNRLQQEKSIRIPVELADTLLYAVTEDVIKERLRQVQKRGHQRLSLAHWLVVLVEEVGEFAEAIQAQEGDEWSKPTDAQHTYDELIQIAAVAKSAAEQIKGESLVWANSQERKKPNFENQSTNS